MKVYSTSVATNGMICNISANVDKGLVFILILLALKKPLMLLTIVCWDMLVFGAYHLHASSSLLERMGTDSHFE